MTNKDILSERIAFYLDADGRCHWKYLGMIDDSEGTDFFEERPSDLDVELGTCRVCGKNPIRYNFILKNTVTEPEANWKYVSVGSECIQFLSKEDFLRIKRDQKRLKAEHDRINAMVFGEYLRDHVVGNQSLWNVRWIYLGQPKNLGGSVKFLMNYCLSGTPMHEKTFGKEVRKALKENGIDLPSIRQMKDMKAMADEPSPEDFKADIEAEKRAESAYERFYEMRSGILNDRSLYLGAEEPEKLEEEVKMVPDGYELVSYYGISPITGKRDIMYETLKNLETGEEEYPDVIPEWDPDIEVVNAVDWNREAEAYEPIDVGHVHLQKFIAEHKKIVKKEEDIDPVLKALKLLAGDDPDFAATRNNVGFNKMDADFGHSLASNNHLSDRQREYGKKLLRKYHRQIPSDLWIEIFGDARND